MHYFKWRMIFAKKWWFHLWVITVLPMTYSIKPYIMQTVILDSADGASAPPVVVKGLSGYIYSHDPAKAKTYRPDRRYFLTIDVPENYRIQIQVIRFDLGYPKDATLCYSDSLFLFNNQLESNTVPTELSSSLGEMIGEYCHNLTKPVLAASSRHSLVLYWHTVSMNSRFNATKGFVLKWTAFKPHDGSCSDSDDFVCSNGQICVPIELACDSVQHCSDESDLSWDRRSTIGCEKSINSKESRQNNVPIDIVADNSFSPSAVAGIIVAVILALILVVTVIACCFMRSNKKSVTMEMTKSASATTASKISNGCPLPAAKYSNIRCPGSACVANGTKRTIDKVNNYDSQRLNDNVYDESHPKRPPCNYNYYCETEKCII